MGVTGISPGTNRQSSHERVSDSGPAHVVGDAVTGPAKPGRAAAVVRADDHVRGAPAARVTLLEYGDYQCRYCRVAHPVVQELLRRRPDVVRFVYRHFPLTTVHPYADLAAEVAESAASRGRFWSMHDWLFENQERLSPRSLPAGVREIGLDVSVVAHEVGTHAWLDRIRQDVASGVRGGVRGTPAFFVNGTPHDRSYSLVDLTAAVDRSAARR